MSFRLSLKFVISLDKIVRHIECVKLLQFDKRLQVVDLIVRDPQLFKGFPNRLDPRQALDQVPAK